MCCISTVVIFNENLQISLIQLFLCFKYGYAIDILEFDKSEIDVRVEGFVSELELLSCFVVLSSRKIHTKTINKQFESFWPSILILASLDDKVMDLYRLVEREVNE